MLITLIRGLITLLMTTHDPPSRVYSVILVGFQAQCSGFLPALDLKVWGLEGFTALHGGSDPK